MWRNVSGKHDSDSHRARMAAERDRIRRSLSERTPDGPVHDRPWWKEWLESGKKREWILVIGLSPFLLAYFYEQKGLWNAGFMAAVLLLGAWWKRRELKAEEEPEPVLELRDSGSDEYGGRN